MTTPDLGVLLILVAGGLLLVGTNVVLQRVARPDRGSERIAGCCGTALRSAITNPQETDR